MISEKKRRPTSAAGTRAAAAARLSFEQPPRQTTFANAKCKCSSSCAQSFLLLRFRATRRFFFFVLEQRASRERLSARDHLFASLAAR